MKQKAKRFLSMALAVLMLCGTVHTGYVFAASTDVSSPSESIEAVDDDIIIESDDVVATSEPDEIIVTDVERKVGASVEAMNQPESGFSAGSDVDLHLNVFNHEKSAAEVRLYFWAAENLPEDKALWMDQLTIPYMDVQIENVDADGKLLIPVEIAGEKAELTTYMKSETASDGSVASKYLTMNVGAGVDLDFTVRLHSDEACKVAVTPGVMGDSRVALLGVAEINWAVNDIVITDVTPENTVEDSGQTSDDVVIDMPDEMALPTVSDKKDTILDSAQNDVQVETPDAAGTGSDEIMNGLPTEELEFDFAEPENSMDMSDKDEIEVQEAVNNKVTDPVLESYIRENLNTEWVKPNGYMGVRNALLVRHVLVDDKMVTEDDTFDTIMGANGRMEAIWMQTNAHVAMYDVGDPTYLVAVANTMKDDPHTKMIDYEIVISDNDGHVIEDAHYDESTGIVYIPKQHYVVAEDVSKPDELSSVFEGITMQFLQAMPLDFAMNRNMNELTAMATALTSESEDVASAEETEIYVSDITSAVSVAVESDNNITKQQQTTVDVLAGETEVHVNSGLDKSSMVVMANGLPMDEASYEYDAKSGKLTLNGSSSQYQSVYVTAEEQTVGQKLASFLFPAVQAAPEGEDLVGTSDYWTGNDSEAFKKMNAVATVRWNSVPVPGDIYKELRLDLTYYTNQKYLDNPTSSIYSYYFSDIDGNVIDPYMIKMYRWINGQIHEGSHGESFAPESLNLSGIVMARQYMQHMIDLKGTADKFAGTLPFEIISTNTNEVWLKCIHPGESEEILNDFVEGDHGGDASKIYYVCGAYLRILSLGSEKNGKPYIICGISTAAVNTQSGNGLIKLYLEESKGGLSIYKKSADENVTNGNSNYDLAGAEYGIWSDGANYGAAPDYGYMTVHKNGNDYVAMKDELPAGKYWVKETKPSPGFGLDTSWHEFTVKPGQAATSNWQYSNEPPLKGGLGIYKRSADKDVYTGGSGYTLFGAEYGIWKDGSNRNGNPDYTMVTGSYSDDCTFAHIDDLPLGVYWVRETKAPSGYDLDRADHGGHGAGWFKFNVTANKTSSQNTQNSYDPPKSGSVSLIKSSSLPDITNGNPMYSLAGAEYQLYNKDNNKLIRTLRTDAAGKASAQKIPLGNYYLIESKAPDSQSKNPHYGLDKTKHNFSITSSNYNTTVSVQSKEPPISDPGTIVITKKLDHGSAAHMPPLTGTEFTVKYYATLDKANYASTPVTREWVFGVQWYEPKQDYRLTFNEDYFVRGDALYYGSSGYVTLPIGTYTIQETKAAPGYEIEGTITYVPNDPATGLPQRDPVTGDVVKVTQSVADLFVTQVTDTHSGIGIMVDNVSMTNEATPIKLKIVKMDTDQRPLQGVKFKIESVSNPDFKFEYDPEQISNAHGEIVFDDLEPGDYVITETKTADGNMLLKDPIKVSVPMKMTAEQVADNNVDVNAPSVKKGADGMYYVYEFTYNVTNTPNVIMPMTGGFVTPMIFLPLVGGIVIFGLVAVMAFKKKKKTPESNK